MKKIILINTNEEINPYPVAPIGMSLIKETLKEDYEVIIYDGMSEEIETLLHGIISHNPDYIGFTIRNIDNIDSFNPVFYIQRIKTKYINRIKKITNVPIILGGSGYSIFPEEIKNFLEADYGIVGEGGAVFLELLKQLDKNVKNPELKNAVNKNNVYYPKADANDNNDLDLTSNLYKNINFDVYKTRGFYPIQTKRGCNFSCLYCTYPNIEGHKLILRSPESIVDEIEDVSAHSEVKVFEIVDSIFNEPEGHAEAICREIINRKLKIKLRTMGINPAHVSHELFSLMMKAGFDQIHCTPDTASEKMLKNLSKNFNMSQLIKTAEFIRDFQLPTMWFFILGGPGETKETIDESFEFIDKHISKLDMVHISLGLRIYPNTQLYNIALEEGQIKADESILQPKFYITKNMGFNEINEYVKEKLETRPHCLTANQSSATPNMLKKAHNMRRKFNLNEPMFRTLLRLRYKSFGLYFLEEEN